MTTQNQGPSNNQGTIKGEPAPAASFKPENIQDKPESSRGGAAKNDELKSAKDEAINAYHKMLEAKQHFQTAAQAAGLDFKHDASEQLHKGRVKAQALSHQLGNIVHERPLATLGAAFLVGFLISQLCPKKRIDY